jgi:hydrogenase maturation protein HypF
VGFRPFIYQLANHYGLKGEVANTATGVSLVLEGPENDIQQFIEDLPTKKPPLAHIVEVSTTPEAVQGFAAFSIVKSRGSATRATLISPDVMVCDDCLAEMRDPADRRFGYPFINCTNCGPRYTIIDDVPYDRPKTSMRHFRMCPLCQAEYDDPDNRRFHAQPNACPVCGPRVTLCDAGGKAVDTGTPSPMPPAESGRAHRRRQGLGWFSPGRGCHPCRRRGTPSTPKATAKKSRWPSCAAVWIASGRLPMWAKRMNGCWYPPASHCPAEEKAREHADCRLGFTGNRYFGIMLPYTPLHHLLLDAGFAGLGDDQCQSERGAHCHRQRRSVQAVGAIADDFLNPRPGDCICAATTPSSVTVPATCVPFGAPGATCLFPCF